MQYSLEIQAVKDYEYIRELAAKEHLIVDAKLTFNFINYRGEVVAHCFTLEQCRSYLRGLGQ